MKKRIQIVAVRDLQLIADIIPQFFTKTAETFPQFSYICAE